jgi:ankyrin repeat protein
VRVSLPCSIVLILSCFFPRELLTCVVSLCGSTCGTEELQNACSEQPQRLDTIRSLVRRCPEVVKTKDVDGWLPLHFTCSNNARLEVVQYLVEQWPEAVKKTTVNGSLPIHLLCSNNAPLEVIQYLVEQWPEAVMTTKDGWLPLHYACDNVCFYKAPLKVIQFLVEQWPEAVKKTTVNGSLPLHYACSKKAPLEVMQYLVEQWPEAVKKINTSGLTPLNQETRPEVVAWLQDVDAGRITFTIPSTSKQLPA